MPSDREKINNLEDALKIIDDSDIPPAPVSERSLTILPVQSVSDAEDLSLAPPVDKFGIPVSRKRSHKRTGESKLSQISRAIKKPFIRKSSESSEILPGKKPFGFMPADKGMDLR